MPEGVALARDLVGPAMESAIARLTPDVRVVAAYHLGLADAAGNPIRSGSGKALRPALAELFPAARDARVTEFFVTSERRATFRQTPGSGALRPKTATARPGLVLAGAWTDTGWPDTMEGAVRSGLAAAVELRRTVLSSTSTIGERQ